LVSSSPWPLLLAVSLLLCASFFLFSLRRGFSLVFVLALLPFFLVLVLWFISIARESMFGGCHTKIVQRSLTLGWLAFLCSEVMFFFSFFWAYLHFRLSPDISLGSCWPPTGLVPLSPWGLPFLNTALLLASSATVTWSHSALVHSDFPLSFGALLLTLLLSSVFLLTQYLEYKSSPFTISDSCYGSIFFLATGFHGLHVLIGSVFLFVCLCRLCLFQLTRARHLGFLFAV